MEHVVMEIKEEWRPVLGYNGRYEVCNLGIGIRTNLRRNKRILKAVKKPIEQSGHWYVSITVNGVRKKKYLHTAVLEVFDCPRPYGLECRHLDGNPDNNHINNLKWGTHSENSQDSIKHGTFNFVGVFGSKHHNAILNEKKVAQIRKILMDKSMQRKDIASKFGVCASTIDYIRIGKIWPHVKI